MEKFSLEFVSDRDLYQSYMPFLKHGGIFIRTPEQYELGTECAVDIMLPDSLEPSTVEGKVCWLTPLGAQNGTPAGVGISFLKDPDNIRNQIEKSIARFLNSSEPTLTM
ncbi:PilZ domain-containing protein [Endozoicomonas sp. G2_1]|uniref:PilZ domain-containing protein n=1 Tax=Endozoicomonas sp. G2_1 TaxID=2821091 RepID=UPI001ADA37E6|nr:PilZ domain-containing protein [Endozoicomonas sp. G2_1]MBO9490783.1 PilZ domain-containing protein [Endozoicomonas sp. G2_1]